MKLEIIRIESSGEPIFKQDKCFAVKLLYTLEDGQKIEYTTKRKRKKDLVADLATLPKAPDNTTYIDILPDGRIRGFTIVYDMARK